MFIISISCLDLMDKSYSNFLLTLLTIPHKDRAFKASLYKYRYSYATGENSRNIQFKVTFRTNHRFWKKTVCLITLDTKV